MLMDGDEIVDDDAIPLGIREISFDADHGFALNGQHIKLNGVCLHHDGGCVGAAVPERVWERRLELLKQMGCNAIRSSHYPPAPEFLDLCDRMGFLVMDEAFDEWRQGKVLYSYHQYFDEWSEEDLVSMLRRDRNHPSIVLWSVGNEVPEQSRPEGAEILRQLIEIVRREDPTRPITSACDHMNSPTPTTLGVRRAAGCGGLQLCGPLGRAEGALLRGRPPPLPRAQDDRQRELVAGGHPRPLCPGERARMVSARTPRA